jgi:putative hydrolase of HD superfamily
VDCERLESQIRFILEIDKLKRVSRRTILTDRSRRENAAEHSWHIGVMALVLSEYASGTGLDMLRVLKMLLLHDVVEIDAGDTYCYDAAAAEGQRERERQAAERLFGLLPQDQADVFRALWEEFEGRQSPEAKFAAALDMFQPILHNYRTEGATWKEHGIRSRQVLERNRGTGEGATALWKYVVSLVGDAVKRGYLME